MTDLPIERTFSLVYQFENTEVGYVGPLEVELLQRSLKRWVVCLFACLSSRAIHLKVDHTLDTESCLTAIKKFIERLGKPMTLISENAINSFGSAKELK